MQFSCQLSRHSAPSNPLFTSAAVMRRRHAANSRQHKQRLRYFYAMFYIMAFPLEPQCLFCTPPGPAAAPKSALTEGEATMCSRTQRRDSWLIFPYFGNFVLPRNTIMRVGGNILIKVIFLTINLFLICKIQNLVEGFCFKFVFNMKDTRCASWKTLKYGGAKKKVYLQGSRNRNRNIPRSKFIIRDTNNSACTAHRRHTCESPHRFPVCVFAA